MHNNPLQLPVEVGEALDVQHVDLVDEEHAGHQLRHPVVYVLVHHLQESLIVMSLHRPGVRICKLSRTSSITTKPLCLSPSLVDLLAELVCDLRLLRLHELPHHGEDVLASLRPRVGRVQVVQGHVLDHLLPLVHVPLRQRDVLLRLERSLMS